MPPKLRNKTDTVVLDEKQKEQVLELILGDRHRLFGKVNKGVKAKDKNAARKEFIVKCQEEGIPYQDWDKAEKQYNRWKVAAGKLNTKRNQTGSSPIPFKKWEQLIADIEPNNPKYNPDKKVSSKPKYLA